jgi:hypothetical protein
MQLAEHGRWSCRVLPLADVCHAWLNNCIAARHRFVDLLRLHHFCVWTRKGCHYKWRRPSLVLPYVTEKPLPNLLPAATLKTSSPGGSTLPVQAGTASELYPSSASLQDDPMHSLAGTDGMHGDQCHCVPQAEKWSSHETKQALDLCRRQGALMDLR